MELIRISDSKLKITLDAEDMAHYAITSDLLNYENRETRRIIWQILDEAKEQTGFHAATDRILIQVYPSRAGGCEMYVTKLLPPMARKAEGEKIHMREEKRELYFFSELNMLLRACKQLALREQLRGSAVYVLPEGGYYLFLWGGECECQAEPPSAYNPAEEYGERQKCGSARLAYIREHAACLCEGNAVHRLAALC